MSDSTLRLATVLALSLGLAYTVRADDVTPRPSDETAKPAVEPDDAKPTITGDEDLDELLKRLLREPEEGEPLPQPGTDEAPATLAETVDRMRRAGQRIGDDSDTGAETRALQQQAVDDLDRLLELAKRQQRQQSNGRPRNPRPNDEPPQEGDDPMPMPGERPEPMPAGDPMDGDPMNGDEGRPEDDMANESTDRVDEGRDREAELAEHRRLVKDVWGHLPPTMREQLLNAYTDKPLPKYEGLVRAYFKTLAEKSTADDQP